MKIAFIGLGNMGAPMARVLSAAGHEVVGVDPLARPEGIPKVATIAEACDGAVCAISMLPNGQVLQAAAAEIRAGLPTGALHLDCSTVDVESARHVATQAEEAGLMAVDAPVSGGIKGAADGTLTFMVGGSDAAYATALPLFEIMGQKSVHCGAAGAGQAAKICNNMILGITMLGTCEAFALADKMGLSRQAMYDVVSTSSGYSWSMNAYCPAPGIGPESPADNDYKPGFSSELMLKDLRLGQDAAAMFAADTPMGAQAAALYADFVERGGGGKDFSAVLPWLENNRQTLEGES